MKNIQLEIVGQGTSSTNEVYNFWQTEWDKVFQKLMGKKADPNIFFEQSFFYVLKFDGEIGAVMSSAWQSTGDELSKDQYYQAWPDAIAYLHSIGVTTFQKMGMIAANRDRIPKDFKISPVIVGCGFRFAKYLPENQAVVSFPRPDTPVYQACIDWGSRTPKSGLFMYNAPVNFITLMPEELRDHPLDGINKTVDNLWNSRTEITAKTKAA